MLRKILLVLIIAVICISSGFWVGSHPQYYQQYLDLNKQEILFYSEDLAELFPPALQKKIQKISSVKVRFISSDPEAADVLLVDQNYLKLSDLNADGPKKTTGLRWQALFKNVSPDFQLDLFRERRALPVLWKAQDGRLRILSFIIDTDKGEKSSVLWGFVHTLVTDDLYSDWLSAHTWNTTLLKYDESSLDEKRKASALRKMNLQKLDL